MNKWINTDTDENNNTYESEFQYVFEIRSIKIKLLSMIISILILDKYTGIEYKTI